MGYVMDDWASIETAYRDLLARENLPVAEAIAQLGRWRSLLLSSDGGRASLDSLERECYLTIDEKALIVFGAIIEFAPSGTFDHHPQYEGKPFAALASSCARYPDKGPEIPVSCGELARFMLFEHASHIIPRLHLQSVFCSKTGRSLRAYLSDPLNFRNPRLLRALEGRIRGGKDVNVFSTTATWVDSHRLDAEALAERVRDGLGLPHLEQEEVVEIRILEETVRTSGTFRKPTFADAQGWPPFLPSTSGDVFGQARDIGTAPPGERGGPEIWHGDLLARQASGIRFLGRPRNTLRPGFWAQHKTWLE
jgi:hypothetical protein